MFGFQQRNVDRCFIMRWFQTWPVLLLILSSLLTCNSSEVTSVDQMIEDLITEHKRDVNEILNIKHDRVRREEPMYIFNSYTVTSVDEIPDLSLPTSKCQTVFEFKGETLLFTCGTTHTKSVLYGVGKTHLTEIASLKLDSNIIKIEAEVYQDQVYIAVVPERGPMYIYRLVVAVGKQGLAVRTLDRIQTIKPYGVSASALVYQFRDKLWLILVNKRHDGVFSESAKTISAIYEWNGAHFDEVYSFETTGALAVEVCEVESTLYIGIAQYQDDNGNYQTGSPIYRFNPVQSRFEKFQVLRSNGARDIIHFYYERRNYLAIANEMGPSVIYWWAGDQFLEWQLLPNEVLPNEQTGPYLGSILFRAISLPNDYQHILMLAQYGQLLFYIESEDGHFTLRHTLDYVQTAGVNITDATVFKYGGGYRLLVGMDQGYSNMYPRSSVYQVALAEVEEPIRSETNPLLQCLAILESEVFARQEALAAAKAQLPYVWVVDEDQTIKAIVEVTGSVTTGPLSLLSGLITVDGEVPDITTDLLEVETDQTRRAADQLLQEFDTVVTKSTDQQIEGFKTFLAPLDVASGTFTSISNDVVVNGEPWSRLMSSTLRYTGDQTFLQPVQFQDVTAGSVLVDKLVNGINTADLMLTRGDQIVTGYHELSSLAINGDLNVPIINGVHLDTLVRRSGDQTISGRKVFLNLNVEGDIAVHRTVNEVDLSDFASRAMLTVGDQYVSGQLAFAQDVAISSDVMVYGTVAGVNVTDLADNVVTKDTQQIIHGSTKFSSDVTIQDISLAGLLNGVDIPDDIFTTNTDQEFTGTLMMDQVHIQGNLHNHDINGIDLHIMAVVAGTDAEILGKKTFQSTVKVEGDILMPDEATISGIDISELKAELVMEHTSATIYGKKTFPSVDCTTLQVGTVNGQSLDGLDDFWRKSIDQVIPGDVTIEGPVAANSVDVDTVNGYDLQEDFVHTFGDERIIAPVHFDYLTVHGDIIATGTTINELKLRELDEKAVRVDGDYVIGGQKTFTDDVNIVGHVTSPHVNGRSLHEYLQTKNDQVITAPYKFEAPVYVEGDIIAGDIDIDETINGYDLEKLGNEAVLTDKEAKVHGHKIFHGLEVRELEVKKLAGIDIDDFFNSVMTISGDQTVTGDIEFHTAVDFEGPLTAGTVNGLNLQDHISKIVRSDRDQVVTGHKTFTGNFVVEKDLHVDTVNGISIHDLAENSLLKSVDQQINGHYVFHGDVTIDQLEIADGRTLDTKLVSNLVFTNRDAVFQQEVVFSGDVDMTDLTVEGRVNGCDLNQLFEQAVYTTGDQVLGGYKTIGQFEVEGSVSVAGLVSGVNVTLLADTMVTIDGQQTIYGHTKFDSGLAVTDLQADSINDVDINFLYEDAVRNSLPQKITGRKVFEGGLSVVEQFQVLGNLDIPIVNGVDIPYLADHVVTRSYDHVIDGHKTFHHIVLANHLTLGGLLNEISIPDDLLLTSSDAHLPEMTTFTQGLIAGELVVDGLLDGVDLYDLLERRVTLSGDQTITGDIRFGNRVHVKGNIGTLNSINGIALSSLVLATVPQLITGPKTFRELEVDGDITVQGLVNGYDIKTEAERIVCLNKPAVLRGKTVFEGRVTTTGDMTVSGRVDEIKIRDLPYLLASSLDGGHDSIRALNTSLLAVQDQLDTASELSESLFAVVQYLELNIEVKGMATKLLSLQVGLPQSVFVWVPSFIPPGEPCHQEIIFNVASWSIPIPDTKAVNLPVPSRTVSIHKIIADKSKRCRLQIGNMPGLAELRELEDVDSPITDLQMFTVNNELFAVYLVGSSGSVGVVKYSERMKSWVQYQELEDVRASGLDVIYTQDSLLLAVANHYSKLNDSFTTYSQVYGWSSVTNQFSLIQTILTDAASSIAFAPEKEELLLVIGQTRAAISNRRLATYPTQVYRFNSTNQRFSFLHSVDDVNSVSSLTVTEAAGKLLVVTGSNTMGEVHLLEWQGAAGYVSTRRVPLIGVTDVQAIVINDQLKLIVSLDSATTVILDIKFNGPRQLW